ncbi:MAG: DUF192 domain-containing protein [Planctomycetes bacterium]|nr:DUF192 domain-containing protein [Planctomycetota bacterium]
MRINTFILAVLFCHLLSCGSKSPVTPEYCAITVNSLEINAKICATYKDRMECFIKGNPVKDRAGILLIYPEPRNPFICNIGNISEIAAICINRENTITDVFIIPPASETEYSSQTPCRYILFAPIDWNGSAKPQKGGSGGIPDNVSAIAAEPETNAIMAGGKNLHVEIADDEYLQRRGLMYRKSMPADFGMLFIYAEEDMPGFWMKNTHIPLSIAYIKSDLTIAEIHDRRPFDLEGIPPKVLVKYVLEVNQGWFKRNNVKAGDKITLP